MSLTDGQLAYLKLTCFERCRPIDRFENKS